MSKHRYTTLWKFGVSKVFFVFVFFKEINTFIQQAQIKLIKSDSKSFIIITKKYIFQINAVSLSTKSAYFLMIMFFKGPWSFKIVILFTV